jgi:hypothetical protein
VTLSDTSVSSTSIGDVNFGLYYQIVKETNEWPDIVGSFRVKSATGTSPFGIKLVSADPNNNNLITPAKLPTGTGIWNFTAGVSVLKTYDPVVLFGSLSYTYNVATSFADISSVQGQVEPGKVKLGDIFQIGAGAAIALSDKTSASLSFTTAIEPETKTDTGCRVCERPRQPDQCVHHEFWTEPGHQQASDDQWLSQHRTHPRCAGLRGRVAFPVHLLTAKRRGYRARTHSFNKSSSGCEKT